MKNIRAWLWLVCAVCLIGSTALSQKVGSTSMQFLKVMPVARATALGDAYSVWASGADAVFWNPSGVASIVYPEMSSTYISWIFDTQQGALSYAAPLGSLGAFGLQLQYVDFGEIDEAIWVPPYSDGASFPGLTGRTFRPYSYLAGITYARNLTDRFAFGLSAKYAHESLYNDKTITILTSSEAGKQVKTWANGFLFDFGIHFNTGYRTIQIGAAVQNFGADEKYALEASPAPLLFRWGVAADLLGKDALLAEDQDNRIGLAFDLFQPNDYDQQEHVGIEYEYAGILALRAGYKFNYDYEGLTVGGGVKHSFESILFSLDYSYGSKGVYLGNVHRISLGARIQ